MPPACYTLSRTEKKNFCQFLSSTKFPDGFASNIPRCVKTKECQLLGMKSHDYHVFLQRLLPLATRGMLPKDVYQILVEISNIFRKICSRTLYLDELEMQEKNIVLILCKLEKIFPPNFFDVMVHLMVHLPTEAKIAGPAQYRWMFPFERKMGQYKGYVHNRARPVLSDRNKTNRSKQKTAHTAGTKSFLRHKAEREAKEGRTNGPIELYDVTHFSWKKNAMVDENSAKNLSKMKELQLESQSIGTNRTEEDICIEVTGHITGYVRGRGPSKTSLIAQRLADIEDFKKRAEEAEKQRAEMEIQLQSQQQLMQRLETQQAEMQQNQIEMQQLLKALRAELQSKKQGSESTYGGNN